MHFQNKVCYLVYLFVTFAWSIEKFNLLHPIEHEMRFTKFQLIVNESFGTVFEATFKQYYDKQIVDVHMLFRIQGVIYTMTVEFNKCKEHYIDCINIRTFQVKHMCNNMRALAYFLKVAYQSQEFSCALKGDYVYTNATFDMQNLITILSSPMSNWWDYCYKWKFGFYNNNNELLLEMSGQNHFLTYRKRNHKP